MFSKNQVLKITIWGILGAILYFEMLEIDRFKKLKMV